MNQNLDVLILGGGMAGLSAGLYFKDSKKLDNFLILEALDRVGGRVHTFLNEEHNTKVDLGAGWLGEGHHVMYGLIKRYNLEDNLILQVEKGKNIWKQDGQPHKQYSGIIPPMSIKDLLTYEWNKRKLDSLVDSINLEDEYSTKNAEYLDSISFRELAIKTFPAGIVRNLFLKAIGVVFGSDFHDLSALHVLAYIKSNRSIDYLFENENGGQQHKIRGGTSLIPQNMQRELQDKILFSKKVKEVIKEGENNFKVVVQNLLNSQTEMYQAKQVIISIPARVQENIKFSNFSLCPTIPVKQKYEIGGYLLKNWAVYKSPFWMEKGFSGMALTPDELVTVTYDCSSEGKGLIMGFILGDNAITYLKMSEKEREKYFIDYLVKCFGEQARNYMFFKHSEFYKSDYTKGCPTGALKVNGYKKIEEAQKNYKGTVEENIHFVGTEYSKYFRGYMEGAAQSGIIAAKNILQENTQGLFKDSELKKSYTTQIIISVVVLVVLGAVFYKFL